MLFKLSVRNIRRSMRDYAIYFFTLLIGVSVFYVFNAVSTQAAYMRVAASDEDVVQLLEEVLSGVSVFVAAVLGLLIVYASRFLMKRRSKEFALYMMLGMGKGKISALLLTETILIGLGSLAVGLPLGIGLSQLMSALVANLFEADMTEFRFIVSGAAIVKTCIYFGIMYLVVMLFNSFMIGKSKLIDLMNSGKRSEKLHLKNPVLCVVIFIAAAAMLGFAYYKVSADANNVSPKKLGVYILMGCVSTFFIFWSVSGMLLRLIMSAKGLYYRGLGCFTFRQFSGKRNTMVMSMTVICLMLFVTICALSSAFSIRNSMNSNVKQFCPADFEAEFLYWENEDTHEPIYTDIVKLYKKYGYDITEGMAEYVHFPYYHDESFTLKKFTENAGIKEEDYPILQFAESESLIRLSDYNALMKLYGRDTVSMADDEFILISNMETITDMRDEVLTKGMEINVFGKALHSKTEDTVDGFIQMGIQKTNTGAFIIPDSVADDNYRDWDVFIGKYAVTDNDAVLELDRKLWDASVGVINELYGEDKQSHYLFHDDKRSITNAGVGLGAIVTFLGLYVGLVFMIACGAVLALKELSEDVDSQQHYSMLRKLGVEEKDIRHSLLVQTGLFFLLPLLLAGLHSVFGMKYGLFILEIFGNSGLLPSVILTAAILTVIYGGYFLITYICGRSIISEKK